MDLATLFTQPEGKTLEFKRDLSSPDGFVRAAVAFANTAGGTILIGVEDGTTRIQGVADPVAIAEQAANILSHRIAPRLVPDIEVLPWRKTQLVAVTVYPVRTGPHYVAAAGPENGTYVRVGASNRQADAALLAELRRLARNEPFDEQPMPEAMEDEIDLDAVRARFAPVRSIDRTDLATLRLVTAHQGRTVPTVGGLLLFGRDRFRYFPDAYIKVGLFGGKNRRHILDSIDVRGPLLDAVPEVLAFVQKQLRREFVIGETTGARRVEQWTVPLAAVREAIANAIVHADYSHTGAPIRVAVFDDRIEIDNPGLLPMGLTLADVRAGVSKLRNRTIGRIWHELGLIEQWGSGIRRMYDECAAVGLEAPVLEEIALQFRVRLSTLPARSSRLDVETTAMIGWLREVGGASTRAVADHFGISVRTARTRLATLVARGLVAELASSPTDPRRQYVATRKELGS